MIVLTTEKDQCDIPSATLALYQTDLRVSDVPFPDE